MTKLLVAPFDTVIVGADVVSWPVFIVAYNTPFNLIFNIPTVDVPVVAVLCACAKGTSELTGVGFIRNKESDRLGDVALELTKCGIDVEVLPDGLRIVGGTPRGAVIDTHHDHRVAMAFSVLSVVADGMVIQNADVVSKSWPKFYADMSSILGPMAQEN